MKKIIRKVKKLFARKKIWAESYLDGNLAVYHDRVGKLIRPGTIKSGETRLYWRTTGFGGDVPASGCRCYLDLLKCPQITGISLSGDEAENEVVGCPI